MIATSSPSSACWRRVLAAARCLSLRAVKYETRTFASMTTLRKSDAPSTLPRFLDRLDGVVGAALDGTFPTPQTSALGRDGDAATVYFPRQLGAGTQVQRIADFLRNGGLTFAGDGRGRHAVSPYQII